jgi:hypothetical protein
MQGTKRKIPTEETKPTNQKSANNSDDLQHLLSILGDHPYMQEDIQLKGKPPCIIAYTSDQLQDLKNFCSTDAMHTSVIAVDRTFNLGAVYVTITVFHNNNLIRKTSWSPRIDKRCCKSSELFADFWFVGLVSSVGILRFVPVSGLLVHKSSHPMSTLCKPPEVVELRTPSMQQKLSHHWDYHKTLHQIS